MLVGHSLGGVYVRRFASMYPNDVRGLVLVDRAHPDQLDRFPPQVVADVRQFHRMIGWTPLLARLGVMGLTGMLSRAADGLPPDHLREARRFGSSPTRLATSHAELRLWDSTMSQVRASRALGGIPLLVISAGVWHGDGAAALPVNHALHRELAALSSRGRHIVLPRTDYMSLLMNRTGAVRTSALVMEFIESR